MASCCPARRRIRGDRTAAALDDRSRVGCFCLHARQSTESAVLNGIALGRVLPVFLNGHIIRPLVAPHINLYLTRQMGRSCGAPEPAPGRMSAADSHDPSLIRPSGDARSSADEHAQTSVSEHGDRHCPRPAGAGQGAEETPPGCSSWTRNHPPPESLFPRAAARKVSASVQRACIPDTYVASGPNREPRRILIPGDGAVGDQGEQNTPACPAMVAMRRLRAVPSQ